MNWALDKILSLLFLDEKKQKSRAAEKEAKNVKAG